MAEPRDDRLVELAEEARRKGMEIAAERELLTPVLVLEDGDRRVHRFLITTGGHPAEAMKVLLYAHRAIRAAICFEGWAVEIAPPPGQEEAWKRDALRGRGPAGLPRASQHPDRFDQLVLLAQAADRPAGFHVRREWRIANGTPRTFEEQIRDGLVEAPSNFWPMFSPPAVVRGLLRLHAELQGLHDRARRRLLEEEA